MRAWRCGVFVALVFAFPPPSAFAAETTSWAGQYADDKFLNGRAVFQLSIKQSGDAIEVSFDAAWKDGHGAAPDAEGSAKVSGNTLAFKFEDSFENSGTGTIAGPAATSSRSMPQTSRNPVASPSMARTCG
jgi:hypothetical protein